MSKYSVDLNCDIGESFGAYSLGNDLELLNYVSSVNIACGFHAGDPMVMKNTVKTALEKGLAIGAHPGLPDLAGFGRRAMAISPEEAYSMVLYQVGALWAFVRAEGGVLHHVKPHGALYNMAAVDLELAEAISEAVYKFNPELILYGLSGSKLIQAADKLGLRTANEVFADRTYQQDGTLTPRKLPGALIIEHEHAVGQAIRMIQEGSVISMQGTVIPIQADTLCLHGDAPNAVIFSYQLHKTLLSEKINIERVFT